MRSLVLISLTSLSRSLISSLIHISFVVRIGCSYLPNPKDFLCTSFKNKDPNDHFVSHHFSLRVAADLRWWVNALSPLWVGRSIKNMSKVVNLQVFVNASTGSAPDWQGGIGLIIGGQWQCWELTDRWYEDRKISYGEALVIV